MAFSFLQQTLADINHITNLNAAAGAAIAQPQRRAGAYAAGQIKQQHSRKLKQLIDFPNLMMLLGGGILNNNGLPGRALIALSNYLDLEHNQDLPSLTAAWEKFYLRNSLTGKPIERWDLQPLCLGQEWENHRHQILELLQATGLLAARFPRYDQYDTLIIHGARLEDIMPRLRFVRQFWLNGGRFKKIVVLTGERKLAADELNQDNWLFFPYKKTHMRQIFTEIDLMQYAWQINNMLAPEIRELPVVWINTPNFKENNGQVRRGITEDTITAWLNLEFSTQQFDLGKCLAVANAPLILRQHLVFERKLYERGINASIETVGLAEEKEGCQWIIYYLREIAGLLWELNRLT
jgi:hypothetical protein